MLQLKKFPHIPVSTREEARESRPHPEEPRFRLIAREEGSFPSVITKEFSGVTLHRKGERNSLSCHHSQSPPDVSVNSRKSYFPCTASTFKPRINSHHGGTWDSPVGKPQWKATEPLIHAKGSAKQLPQLGRKAHVHTPLETRTDSPGVTPEVPQDPCQHWRGILRFWNRLHTMS